MSRKATIDSLFVQKPVAASASAAAAPDRVRTGAIAAMGSSLRGMAEGAKLASRLQEQIAAGGSVVEIEPDRLEGAIVQDRIPTQGDPSFAALKASLVATGQQVPILVRPRPGDRFQIAYGHRRARACADLGLKVRALVRPLSDEDLILAQGQENAQRTDLSFIERAQFARRLEDQGFSRALITTALATDKGNLSRYLAVARAVPEALIAAIGPASRAGRARWCALADRLPGREALTHAVIARAGFVDLPSDARFTAVLRSLDPPVSSPSRTSACAGAVRVDQRSDRTIMTVDEAAAPRFGAYLAGRLETLYREFLEGADIPLVPEESSPGGGNTPSQARKDSTRNVDPS